VRTLPARLDPAALRQEVEPGRGVPIGVAEPDLEVVHVDLTVGDPHLLVYGDGGSGKTTLLRTFLTQLCAGTTPEQARVLVVDPRRALLDVVPPRHLLAYAGAAPAATDAVRRLRHALDERLPGPAVTSRQLRDRSWWVGPELYVVVDDADLVVSATANPLAPLVDVLAQGQDLGVHLVLARRVAGASRSALEPVQQRLRDLRTPAVLLAGDPGEGPLVGGHRAVDRPPGRGLLVRPRARPVLVQVADTPPPEPPGAPG
jgi:S-DNA-T family DNA segregation ATPase FtsK/SpoIIIE